ncbi:MAG TPA: HAD-IA family hydrolase, partial [Candidatus Dormibacteraeota bacterium]|nr:HAD-IA family hydrolase [Candidatus Dormibacteraeota bacterium]
IPARELYVRATREGRAFESSMELAREFWSEYNHVVLGGLGVDADKLAPLTEAIYTTAWSAESWQAFPDAIPALAALREMGIRLAIVSNFVDTLPELCVRSGIDGYFDVVVASVDVGAMKPDPRIWGVALRRLGVQPEDAWHIGDNYWADVMGARAAGLTPVLVDREGLVPNPDCARVGGLEELVALVRRLEEAEAAA